jgi:hypothetical protein
LWLGLCEEFDKDVRELTSEQSELVSNEEIADVEVISDSVQRLGSTSRPVPGKPNIKAIMVETEPYKTARAACGTLACAAFDTKVATALLTEKVASSIVPLLQSEIPELCHRVLVMISELSRTECKGMARHLVEGGIIQAIAVITKIKDPSLGEIAKDAANALSEALLRDDVDETKSK